MLLTTVLWKMLKAKRLRRGYWPRKSRAGRVIMIRGSLAHGCGALRLTIDANREYQCCSAQVKSLLELNISWLSPSVKSSCLHPGPPCVRQDELPEGQDRFNVKMVKMLFWHLNIPALLPHTGVRCFETALLYTQAQSKGYHLGVAVI
jgi:hypothetical protein